MVAGPYSESNGSLHIYGQDYKTKGMDRFFTRFPTCESFVARARTSESVRELEIIPQLQDLLAETTWKFPPDALSLMRGLIAGERGRPGRLARMRHPGLLCRQAALCLDRVEPPSFTESGLEELIGLTVVGNAHLRRVVLELALVA